MTKADIVGEIAKSTGIEKVQVQQVVESFMENIKDSMKDSTKYRCSKLWNLSWKISKTP